MLVKHFYFVIEVENNSFTIKILQCMKITVHIAFTFNITDYLFLKCEQSQKTSISTNILNHYS